jgi:diaminohydroxyphosphoribosylaminopyrimidine deaminase/5-amino-6-(5-phosphoribosylamino)uracil reductase
MADAVDHEHMARALQLAANGLYDTAPNPAVGCVLVRDGREVGAGWTAPAGGPHAEVVALGSAGAAARGATAYVTLEPCCHTGRTGPCTKALLAAGIARVVFAGHDPNPRVNGGGAAELVAAGVQVEGGVMEGAAEPLNRGFFTRMRTGLPYVRSKLAVSLDGRTALANGTSQWITSAAARADVHRWRARSSAVLTGSGTIVDDDPSLDARRAEAQIPESLGIKQPLRVVIDARLKMPPHAKTLSLAGEVLVLTTRALDDPQVEALRASGARVDRIAGDAQHCDLRGVIEHLGKLEINDVWVEAGAGLNGALLKAGLIDELIIYMAPRVLGSSARGMFDLPVLESLADGFGVTFDEIGKVGSDLRIAARVSRVATRPPA